MGNSNSSDNKKKEDWENGVLYDKYYTREIHQGRLSHYNMCVANGGSPDYSFNNNNGRLE